MDPNRSYKKGGLSTPPPPPPTYTLSRVVLANRTLVRTLCLQETRVAPSAPLKQKNRHSAHPTTHWQLKVGKQTHTKSHTKIPSAVHVGPIPKGTQGRGQSTRCPLYSWMLLGPLPPRALGAGQSELGLPPSQGRRDTNPLMATLESPRAECLQSAQARMLAHPPPGTPRTPSHVPNYLPEPPRIAFRLPELQGREQGSTQECARRGRPCEGGGVGMQGLQGGVDTERVSTEGE